MQGAGCRVQGAGKKCDATAVSRKKLLLFTIRFICHNPSYPARVGKIFLQRFFGLENVPISYALNKGEMKEQYAVVLSLYGKGAVPMFLSHEGR